MLLYNCVIPQIDVNDKKVVVSDFLFNNGDIVNKLDNILSLETAKAVSDFYSEETGYISYCVEEFAEISIGDTVAKIFDNQEEAINFANDLKIKNEMLEPQYKATAKAEKLAKELNVDLNLLNKDGIIKEKDVLDFVNKKD